MGPGRDRTPDPGSAVRHASVARHVTDWAKWPGSEVSKKSHNFVSKLGLWFGCFQYFSALMRSTFAQTLNLFTPFLFINVFLIL